jgi:decaprenyl-phosphate phosphoribosyltransferase
MPGNESRKIKFKLYVGSLRLERWPRSLAILPGFIAVFVLYPQWVKTIDYFDLLLKFLLAFILTLFISTANYIVNEITDAPHDAYHPSKKHRPLVNNQISSKVLMALWLLLVIISIGCAYLVYKNISFLISLLALLAAGFLYNVPPIRMKDIPFLDSTLESANNPIRFLIGWHIVKFLTEKESAGYRLSLKKYKLQDLVIFMHTNAFFFVASFCWFALESKLNSFLCSIPFIVVYLIMFIKKSLQDIEGAEEPEKLLKNPYFAFYTLFLVAIFILAYIFK